MNLIPTIADNVQESKKSLKWKTLCQDVLNVIFHTVEKILQSKYLIVVMALLQLLWLAAILWTRASSDRPLLVFLVVYSCCAALLVLLLPEIFIAKLRPFKAWLLQSQRRGLLILSLLAVIAGVFYAGQQQIWGDEERSLRVAKIISAEGVESAYQQSGWLSKKHPPLMPLLYSRALDSFGESLFNLRLVSVLFLVGTLVTTFLVARQLYDRNTGYLASFLFLLFPLVMRLGTSAMMDIQLTFFFSLSLLACLRLVRSPSYWLAALTGLVIGLGLLTKYIMLMVYGVLIACLLFLPGFRKRISYFGIVFAVSLAVFFSWIVYASQIGILAGQIEKIKQYSGIYYLVKDVEATIQPDAPVLVPATGDTQESDSLLRNGIMRLGLETLFTRLPSSLGVHHLPLILFGVILLLKKRQPSDLFLLFWIGVVFVLLFLTLPDHRYFLAAFPAIAIMIARILRRFSVHTDRVVLLSLLFGVGNLYLFVDWVRETHLFL